jgi:23S rRNA (adenine2503-C2)-methyltransferase
MPPPATPPPATLPPATLLNLHGLTRDELRALIASWDFPPVHAARLWNYLYYEAVAALDAAAMPDIPARLMERLRAECTLDVLPVAHEAQSADGFTRKYLLTLPGGHRIETVLMRFTGRVTACISSQAGCAMGCVFCATGQMGFARHLTAAEIVAQALHVQRILKAQGERLRNVVLMGMGEPLHNYDAVMRACEIMRDGSGLALGARKITLSTVGVVPGIMRMADEASPIHLAVSLHAATQKERLALVPAARRWPLDQLIDACRYYVEKLNRRIFFEWTLIDGKNDTEAHACALAKLLSGMQAQVNLIPLNPTSGYGGAPGRTDAAKKFQSILAACNLPSTIRQPRGIDIAAGCGQLAAGG